jgi:hypothetical protein
MTITLYHGTRAAYLPAIDKQGLIPCGKPGNDASWSQAKRWADEQREQSVFMSPRPEIAAMFGQRLAELNHDHGVILEIELPDDMREHLHIDEAGADPDDDGSGIRQSDFMRFDGPIKREWIAGYVPAEDALGRYRLHKVA